MKKTNKSNFISILAIIIVIAASMAFMASSAHATSTGLILNNPVFQAVDAEGIPISGGLVYAYLPGTTTPKDTYTDRACTIPNPWPVVLDANGQAIIYLLSTTKINLKSATGAQQDHFPIDYINGFAEPPDPTDVYPDYRAVDQGVTGNNNTIKYYIDQAAGKAATIHLLHNSGSTTTTYTLTTSETIPDNITLKTDRGAIIDGAGSLTIDSIFQPVPYQVWGGSITLTGLQLAYPEMWGATGDGYTDDSYALQKALDNSLSVLLHAKIYMTNLPLLINSDNQKISGMGSATEIKASGGFPLGENILSFAGDIVDNVHNNIIIDLALNCNARADGLFIGYAQKLTCSNIDIVSAKNWSLHINNMVASFFYNIRIENESVGDGVFFDGVSTYDIYDNAFYGLRIKTTDYGLILNNGCRRNAFYKGMIDTHSDLADAYGIKETVSMNNYDNSFYDFVLENHPTGVDRGTGINFQSFDSRSNVFNTRTTNGWAISSSFGSGVSRIIRGTGFFRGIKSIKQSLVLSGAFYGRSPDSTMTWNGITRSSNVSADGLYDIWQFPIEQPAGSVIHTFTIYVYTDDSAANTKIQFYKGTFNTTSETQIGIDHVFTGAGTHIVSDINYEIENNYHFWITVQAKRSAGAYLYIYPPIIQLDYL